MSADEYLKNTIANKKAPIINFTDMRLANIKSILTTWAGQQLAELKQSGSSAKGTAIKGVSDFDIFISLKSDTTKTLKEIYNLLDTYVTSKGMKTKRQNVSIGIIENGLNIDLVPGKKQAGYQNYHSIYISKQDTWMQTNIDLHITTVVSSKRQNEIILTKIWRQNNNFDFPSIYLELTVLEAVKNKSVGNIANNFWAVLTYLSDNFVSSVVNDPSNTNNKVSNMISKIEKEKIAQKAGEALKQQNWEKIIW
jgi:hypothetical protein